MRSGNVAVGVLATALLAAGPARAEALRKDWLRADVEVARVWGANLGPAAADATPAAYARRLAGYVKEPRDLGFGASTVEVGRAGGYVSFNLILLLHADRVVGWKAIATTGNEAAWAAVRRNVERAWSGRGHERAEPHGWSYGREVLWSDEPRTLMMHAAREAALGRATPSGPVPAALADDYEALTSPYYETDVGDDGCYEGGTAPAGLVAIRRVVAAGRVDLLRVIARGPNPEGRVYAARELMRLPAAGRLPADRALVDALRAARTPTRVCSGCITSTEPAGTLLKR